MHTDYEHEYLVTSLNPNWTGSRASELNAVRIRALSPIGAVRQRMEQVARPPASPQRFVVSDLVSCRTLLIEWSPRPVIKVVER